MKILYLGDIMGPAGRKTVQQLLPNLRLELKADFVIAQAENMGDEGKGLTPGNMAEMKLAGVDFFSGGNWSLQDEAIHPSLANPKSPIIRPANYPANTPGLGAKLTTTKQGDILCISLLGQIVPRPLEVDNPLTVVDSILDQYKNTPRAATIVNFHGDYSSEKLVIGHYLDGKVTAVLGDHWHIPTADAKILPRGTAHITDVGMVGSLESCIGVELEVIIARWQSGKPSRNVLETGGRMQLCAVLIDVDRKTGLAKSVKQIIRYTDLLKEV